MAWEATVCDRVEDEKRGCFRGLEACCNGIRSVSKTDGAARLLGVQVPPLPPMNDTMQLEEFGRKFCGRVFWMDVFDTASCCQKDNMEKFEGIDGAWIMTFVRAPKEFKKSVGGFRPMKCATCGRHWFEVPKGYWTVKAKK